MNRENENNKVTLSGEIVSNFEFSHEVCGKKFYVAQLASERLSGQKDIIPIMASDGIVDSGANWAGRIVKVFGEFRSYNRREEGKSRLVLSVFVREFEEFDPDREEPLSMYDENCIFLDGHICKHPTYRKTPLGREIADILLAVNRPYGKTDYIPCIAWGRSARFASGLEVGVRLQSDGRIQSREYKKWTSNNECETRIAYEVSINKLAAVPEERE